MSPERDPPRPDAPPAGLDCRRDFLRRLAWAGAAIAGFGLPALVRAAVPAPGAWHLVEQGETLSGLARAHGVTVETLRRLNGLTGDGIQAGQRLRVRPAWRHLRPEALDVPQFDPGRWRHCIIHHSATPAGNAAKFDAYHRRERRMVNGLAYHFVIGNGTDSGDGEIEIGPRWTKQLPGGHVASPAYNANSLGLCLIGNFEQSRPTARQMAALGELLGHLRHDRLGGSPTLHLHREVKGEHTLCPGRHFPARRLRQLWG
jgi:LysM repeat protein